MRRFAVARRARSFVAVALLLVSGSLVMVGDALPGGAAAYAAGEHTVTFVNDSGEKVWLGSTVNADGSQNFDSLPILEPGQQATITIPEATGPGYWRGKFFARQRCTGEPGSTFHCAVGDCGNAADRCTINSEGPASLAEFNFDPSDAYGAPWYDVSYVNAVSLPVSITPNGGPAPQDGSQQCGVAGCDAPFLDHCPAANLVRDDQGRALNCVNPDRDNETDYSRAVSGLCPRAYSWSTQDRVPGNQTMFQCKECSGFTITFHRGTSDPGSGPRVEPTPDNQQPPTEQRPVPEQTNGSGEAQGNVTFISQWEGKCIDVPASNAADGVPLQVWDCDNTEAQRWAFADGTLRTRNNLCMDVAWGSRDNGAAVQLATCSGNPAQQWVLSDAGDLVNPQANKCVDIRDWSPDNGAKLQIWECAGTLNQKWRKA